MDRYVNVTTRSPPSLSPAPSVCPGVAQGVIASINSRQELLKKSNPLQRPEEDSLWLSRQHPDFQEGCLADEQFRRKNVGIIVSTAAIATKTFGLVRDVYKKYPYGDIVTIKRTDGEKALPQDRFNVGDVIFCPPPTELTKLCPKSDLPSIINIVPQFNYGSEVEINQPVLERLKKHHGLLCPHDHIVNEDVNFVEGLICDNLPHRINQLKSCLVHVLEIIRGLPLLDTIILPLGILKQCAEDGLWLHHIYPIILEFTAELNAMNKKCIVVYTRRQFVPYCLQRMMMNTM